VWLTHETAEAAEYARDATLRVNLNEHVLGCVNVDLKKPGLVEGAVQEHQQTLASGAG
jgi:hypothetical protein